MSSLYQPKTERAPWFSLDPTANENLRTVALFCALGLLASLYVMVRYPDFSAIVAQFSQL
jgi:hypothetical protein